MDMDTSEKMELRRECLQLALQSPDVHGPLDALAVAERYFKYVADGKVASK